jgi:hypothetical protein
VKTRLEEQQRASKMQLRDKVEQMQEDFDQEQKTTFAVTADMARQYCLTNCNEVFFGQYKCVCHPVWELCEKASRLEFNFDVVALRTASHFCRVGVSQTCAKHFIHTTKRYIKLLWLSRYKALQEDLIQKINGLETTLTEQKEECDMTKHELKELIRDKDDIIAHKEHIIQELKSRMEQMCSEFSTDNNCRFYTFDSATPPLDEEAKNN